MTQDDQNNNTQPPEHWTYPANDRLDWERRHHRWSAEQLERIKERAEQIARERGDFVVTSFVVDAAVDDLAH